jgi:uncharacterized membrane protein
MSEPGSGPPSADERISAAHARLARSLLVMPIARLVLGAERAGLTSHLVEHGFDDQFASDLHQQLEQGGSAIILLTHSVVRDRVLAELTRYGGTLLRTTVSVEDDVLRLMDGEHTTPPVSRSTVGG